MIDLRRDLVTLEALTNPEVFDREWVGFFPAKTGRQATSPRLVAALLHLQNAYRRSDETPVACWVENPHHRHFIGETAFQHRPSIEPSPLTRWRKRIAEEGVLGVLPQTVSIGVLI
jgi:IS5 family transposase